MCYLDLIIVFYTPFYVIVGIDCENARGDEERRMLKDAKQWASGDSIESIDVPDNKTGATALHIAAAKGYIDVMQ